MITKFRVWDKENNQFYVPTFRAFAGELEYLVINLDGSLSMITLTERIHESLFPDRFEIMQSTGLKDQNDVEILEGDIVSFRGEYVIRFGQFGVPNIEEECYQDLAVGFYLEAAHNLKDVEPFGMTIPLNTNYSKTMVVIGNIRENPELLEETK